MPSSSASDFQTIAQAIGYLQAHFKEQPTLEDMARYVNLSPTVFQKMFTAWAGVSPKKFTQYLTLEHAKGLLENERLSLLDVTHKSGLSSAGRLHDLFVTIEGMTPGDYKSQAASLIINYNFATSLFGDLLIASTNKGVCYLAFSDNHVASLTDLKSRFPRANFVEQTNELQQQALRVLRDPSAPLETVKLHLKGTPFQLKIWQSLLTIPEGQISTYSGIAKRVGHPSAQRAVGTAIGNNPVAFLIPCHRVIQSTGIFGNYRWGSERKAALLGLESSRLNTG